MAGHYRGSYNQRYLIVEIEHQGGQTEAFATGTGDDVTEKERQLTYSNAFTSIPASIQFRPECETPRPRFYGTMNAKVDAAGISPYAEIDDQGRYKVKLPFDQAGGEGGKASRWVRMVQPYAGADHGMHFPLHKGTEVLLTFVDGDPDRPIIAGAVPNAETTSVVTSLNATRNTIRSAGGNFLEMQDMAGKERILLSSPHESTYLHMGAPNSPRRTLEESTRGQMLHRSVRNMYFEVGGPEYATEKEFRGNFEETGTTERGAGPWNGEKIHRSTEEDKGHYYLTAKGDHKSSAKNCEENVRMKKEERIGRYEMHESDYTEDEYHYERTVEDNGKLTEKIFDDNHNQTYERLIENTGHLTDRIGDLPQGESGEKYKREIDSSSGDLTEEVKGELTLESDGKMLLESKKADDLNNPEDPPALTLQSDGKMFIETSKGPIEIKAANNDVIIRANSRREYTKSEAEVNFFGNKFQLSGGASEEIFLGPIKFESINGLAIAIALSVAIDIGLFKAEKSIIEIGEVEAVKFKKVRTWVNKQLAKIKLVDGIEITV
jgi:hypothetical protein